MLQARRWLAEPKTGVPQRHLKDLEAGLCMIAHDDGSEKVSWIVRQLERALPARAALLDGVGGAADRQMWATDSR
jgi:hypothetical protein